MKQENSEIVQVPIVHGISYLDGVIVPFLFGSVLK